MGNINIRVSDDERAAMQAAAESAGQSLSDFARAALATATAQVTGEQSEARAPHKAGDGVAVRLPAQALRANAANVGMGEAEYVRFVLRDHLNADLRCEPIEMTRREMVGLTVQAATKGMTAAELAHLERTDESALPDTEILTVREAVGRFKRFAKSNAVGETDLPRIPCTIRQSEALRAAAGDQYFAGWALERMLAGAGIGPL